MSLDLENRVTKLEVLTDHHADDIKELRDTSITMKVSLLSIQKTLDQIKYVAIGALTVVIAQSVGLDKAIRVLFGAL